MDDDRRVRDVGEFGLIDLLRNALPIEVREAKRLAIGIGDDAAVWRPAAGEDIVLTTDSLVDEIHFRLDWTDWESLGHKTLAVNISDIAAMGAAPRLAVVTLGLRGDETIAGLQGLYRGMGALAKQFGVAIAGGDIVRSPRSLALHVAVIGETRGLPVLTRSGAKPGDRIGVSGTLGAAAAGLRILELPTHDARRQAATAELLIEAHVRPEPRVALGEILAKRGATAAMDLSDGLLGDLPKILAASAVSARLDSRDVPVAAAVRALFPADWLDFALRGGEDYELLFTASPDRWTEIAEAAAAIGIPVTEIGQIEPADDGGPAILLTDSDGETHVVAPGAFDHFRRHDD